MFVRREGTDPKLPPVIIGSHLDTQASGGRFDGILGVLGGLEVLRTLDDLGSRRSARSRSSTGPTRKARASIRR